MLHPYQQEAVTHLLHYPRALLALDPGLGKTVVTLTALSRLPRSPTLVVVPSETIAAQWRGERDRWAPGLRLDFVTYAGLPRLHGNAPSILICDEAHYAKNPEAKRSQAVKRLRQQAARTILLTGTPVPNRPDEALGLLDLLGYRYSFPSDQWERWSVGLQPESLRDALIRCGMLRKTKAEIAGQLPSKTRERVWCEVEVDTLLGLATQRKLLGLAKVAEATRLAKQYLAAGEKLLLFAHHHAVVTTLAEQTGLPAINGKTGKTKRNALFQRLQTDASLRGLILNTQVGGVGLNLTAATHELIVEHDWTPAQMRQAEDRICRLGQTQPTTITYLVARHPLDIQLAVTLELKDRDTEVLIDGRLTPGSVYIPEPIFHPLRRIA